MDQLIKDVSKLVVEEYQRAAAEHGPAAHSSHEGYALIKEEAEEAQEQMAIVDQKLTFLWEDVKNDYPSIQPNHLSEIKKAAILGACELIQVAAMADKALAGYGNKEEQ